MTTLPIHAVTLPRVLVGATNGKLPPSILVATPGQAGGPTVTLVAPAARGWRALCAAALTVGHALKATSAADTYRSYAVQESLFRARYTTTPLANRPTKVWQGQTWWLRPGMATAAVPGTSNHGLAIAVDNGDELDGDAGTEAITAATVAWLAANAATYGWSAELQSEPWHWRYHAGDTIPPAVLAYEQGDDDMASVADTILGEIRPWTARTLQVVDRLEAAAAEDTTRDAATLTAIKALAAAVQAGGGSIDVAAITASIQAEAAATRGLVGDLQEQLAAANAELAELRQALAAGAKAEADALAATDQ